MSSNNRDCHVHCVLLTTRLGEFTFLRNVFWLAGIQIRMAQSFGEAEALLRETGGTVLLADAEIGGGWRDALLRAQERYPLVATLLLGQADSVKDVYECGGCGVIAGPFEFQRVSDQIRAAHEASLERRAAVDYFAEAIGGRVPKRREISFWG